jgi:hypothetical protein
MCAGDFNEILEGSEKFGGCCRAPELMEVFKETLAACELSDLRALVLFSHGTTVGKETLLPKNGWIEW